MKHNRFLIEYIRNWVILNEKDLKFTSDNTLNPHGDFEVLRTNITVSHEGTVIYRHNIIWAEVKNLLNTAEDIITEIKEMLEVYNDTGMDISQMYPKTMIMTPDEHKAYIQAMKHKMNSVYGSGMAGNHCYGMTGGYTIPPLGRANGKTLYWAAVREAKHYAKKLPSIKDVIFNEPATIVFWKDGTKTVVKAQDGEEYDPEKGLAMAISKKAMGNNRDYYLTFKKYLKKYNKQYPELPQISFEEAIKRAGEAAKKTCTISGALKEMTANAIKAAREYEEVKTKENNYPEYGVPMQPLYDVKDDVTQYTCPVCGAVRYDEGKTDEDRVYHCKHTHITGKKSDTE